ncbi:DUF6931 family protein [Roseibium sp.]|uniref:DUF6931 family protein n=1 Tax=Roseibium sp. TaxID=1936156 RepID=UPI003B5210D2
MATSRIRFTKASQVFETYPDLDETVARPETDMAPQAYLDELRKVDPPFSALAYFAHVLPKREAVWWGHQCVTGLLPDLTGTEAEIMELCEAWVRDGDDDSRAAVKKAAESIKADSAAVWVGFAAGWSGGSLSPNEDHRVETPDDLTAKAVNTALLIAVGQVGPGDRSEAIDACLNAGLAFAEGATMPAVSAGAGLTKAEAIAAGTGGG